MRQFDACALCLHRAREPVACNEGHLFCKECVYTDLREFNLRFPFVQDVHHFSFPKEGHPATEK
jgi:hypothetical protein